MSYLSNIEPPYYIYKGKGKRVKWPCKSDPNREIELINGDILVENENIKTPQGNNTFDMITGIYKAGIYVDKSDLYYEQKKTTFTSVFNSSSECIIILTAQYKE